MRRSRPFSMRINGQVLRAYVRKCACIVVEAKLETVNDHLAQRGQTPRRRQAQGNADLAKTQKDLKIS